MTFLSNFKFFRTASEAFMPPPPEIGAIYALDPYNPFNPYKVQVTDVRGDYVQYRFIANGPRSATCSDSIFSFVRSFKKVP